MFLPLPEGLLVNLQESKELVIDLLTNLPAMFEGTSETSSALGGALQAAFKLMVGAHSCRLVTWFDVLAASSAAVKVLMCLVVLCLIVIDA